jgi:hypothetical protein
MCEGGLRCSGMVFFVGLYMAFSSCLRMGLRDGEFFLLACWRLRFRLFLLPAFLVALEELFDTPLAVNLHDDYD